MGARAQAFDVVIPSVGRGTLYALLVALVGVGVVAPDEIIVVDDRPDSDRPLVVPETIRVLQSGGGGPARARNVGWRAGKAPWVVFLDDDVTLGAGWLDALRRDLDAASPEIGGIQGRIVVPLPSDRRPTDWERNVAGLESARWATADMAYRRSFLERVGGFDERFPRAFREDADIALRVMAHGGTLRSGTRCVVHPPRPTDRWVSVRAQRGNADDSLMRALHGSSWRRQSEAGSASRFALHALTTAVGSVAISLALFGRRRQARLVSAAGCALMAEFTLRRMLAGPRTRAELTTMALTSPLIPPLAIYHRVRGMATARRALLGN
jgi:glycosyltransferase involved in cell wall biosynthesis